jgi:ferredoxin-NADP reductase
MFAGGIGITPFISYLESIEGLGARAIDSWLFYGNQNSSTHAFRERIESLKRALPTLTVVNCYNQPRDEVLGRDYEMQGFLTADVVSDELIDRRARFYLCGPEPMMKSITDRLVERGVPPFDIFKEAFRSPVKPVLDPSQRFVVQFARSHRKEEWTPDKGTLLSFGESLGIALPSGCRVGQCESCALKLFSGKVAHLTGHGPDESDMCLTCQAIPTGDLCIDA